MTPPMMMNAWTPTIVVRPTASSFSKVRSVRSAMRRPAPMISRYDIRIAVAPIRPSSSPMAAKMKSFCASGTLSGLPRPSPVPTTPPSAMPYSAWTIWYPLSSDRDHGSIQMSTRVCTCPNVRHATYAAPPNINAPSTRYDARSVATHIITTNSVKNSNDEPRSFWPTMTTTENAQATRIGRMWRGSGSRIGPIFQVPAAISSRRSARYPAKKIANESLANSPGWKLIGPRFTQILAPPTE